MNPFLQSALYAVAAGLVTTIGSWGLTNPSKLLAFAKAALAKIPKPSPAPAPVPAPPPLPVDPDHADLDALKRLEARAERRKCPKLQAAIREVEVCFFNEAEAAQ